MMSRLFAGLALLHLLVLPLVVQDSFHQSIIIGAGVIYLIMAVDQRRAERRRRRCRGTTGLRCEPGLSPEPTRQPRRDRPGT